MSIAPLVDSIHFKNYRNFIDFEMKDLAHINLIVGDSNVGKTGLLEGLVTLWGDSNQFINLPSMFRMSLGGGADEENYWQWFFPEKIKEKVEPIYPSFISNSLEKGELFVELSPVRGKSSAFKRTNRKKQGLYRGLFELILLPVGMGNYQQQVDHFNELAQKTSAKEKLLDSLKIIEPRLKGLDYLKLPSSDQAMIYADIGLEYKIPTTQFGHGFTRSMEMLTQLILSDAQIMIADEIENGIHYGSLESVWKAIISYAMQNNIQVFATTHSRECISAAHQAMLEQDDYSLNVIRLQNEDDQVVAINHSQEDIEAALSMGMPLR